MSLQNEFDTATGYQSDCTIEFLTDYINKSGDVRRLIRQNKLMDVFLKVEFGRRNSYSLPVDTVVAAT